MDSIAPGAVYAPRRDGGPITRDELIERIAQVSHATWLVQGVDGGRTLADPYSSGPPGYKGTEEWQADLAEAERMLKAVLDGGRLEDLSPNPKHHVNGAGHDRERGENTVRELERLGLWPPSP